MATTSETEEHVPGNCRAAFYRARLGSVLAVVPLGVWTVVHVWNNLSAFGGASAWESSVTGYGNPAAQIATMIVVLAPLLFHTVWGIGRIFSTKPNYPRYGYFANLKYVLQRLSAVGVLLFLGAHIWLALLRPRFVEGHAETFVAISREMHHHTPTLVVYVLGTLGVAYHLANGLAGVAMGFGIVQSKRALKRLDAWALGFFALLLGMSWAVIYALYNAGA